jgi:hypothetical protein
MPIQTEKREKNLRRLRGRVARSQSFGTKLTPDEERQILAAAEAEEKAPSEWARELLLNGAVASNRGEMEMHLFTELRSRCNSHSQFARTFGESRIFAMAVASKAQSL